MGWDSWLFNLARNLLFMGSSRSNVPISSGSILATRFVSGLKPSLTDKIHQWSSTQRWGGGGEECLLLECGIE